MTKATLKETPWAIDREPNLKMAQEVIHWSLASHSGLPKTSPWRGNALLADLLQRTEARARECVFLRVKTDRSEILIPQLLLENKLQGFLMFLCCMYSRENNAFLTPHSAFLKIKNSCIHKPFDSQRDSSLLAQVRGDQPACQFAPERITSKASRHTGCHHHHFKHVPKPPRSTPFCPAVLHPPCPLTCSSRAPPHNGDPPGISRRCFMLVPKAAQPYQYGLLLHSSASQTVD